MNQVEVVDTAVDRMLMHQRGSQRRLHEALQLGMFLDALAISSKERGLHPIWRLKQSVRFEVLSAPLVFNLERLDETRSANACASGEKLLVDDAGEFVPVDHHHHRGGSRAKHVNEALATLHQHSRSNIINGEQKHWTVLHEVPDVNASFFVGEAKLDRAGAGLTLHEQKLVESFAKLESARSCRRLPEAIVSWKVFVEGLSWSPTSTTVEMMHESSGTTLGFRHDWSTWSRTYETLLRRKLNSLEHLHERLIPGSENSPHVASVVQAALLAIEKQLHADRRSMSPALSPLHEVMHIRSAIAHIVGVKVASPNGHVFVVKSLRLRARFSAGVIG